MHYYQFNIKDYSFATIRMTLMEDLAFRRMLDLYYESEKPLPFELKRIAKLIGMLEHQEEIRDVLNEFWRETESGWVNNRALEEIERYQAKADIARVNGAKGGRPKKTEKPKKTQLVNLDNPEITGSKANHKPITNNQQPNKDIHQQIADMWNASFTELPNIKKLTPKRKSHINAVIKEFGNSHGLNNPERWNGLFEYISTCDFLMGRSNDWRCDFDFVINKNNLLKIIEGKYENTRTQA